MNAPKSVSEITLPFDDRADVEPFAELGDLVGALVAQHRGARNHEAVALLFDAQNAEEEALVEVLGGLLRRAADLHRRLRAEAGDAVDDDVEAALVPADDLAFDRRLVLDRRAHDLARHAGELLGGRGDEDILAAPPPAVGPLCPGLALVLPSLSFSLGRRAGFARLALSSGEVAASLAVTDWAGSVASAGAASAASVAAADSAASIVVSETAAACGAESDETAAACAAASATASRAACSSGLSGRISVSDIRNSRVGVGVGPAGVAGCKEDTAG